MAPSELSPSAGRPLLIHDAAGLEIWRCVSAPGTTRLRCDVRPAGAHRAGDYVLTLPAPSFREVGTAVSLALDGREVMLILTPDRGSLGVERVRELHAASASEARRVDLGDGMELVQIPIALPGGGRFCTWGGWMHGRDVWREDRWWTDHRRRECQCGRCGDIREIAPNESWDVASRGQPTDWHRVDVEVRAADPRTGCDDARALELRVERSTSGTMAVSMFDTWVVRATFRPADLPVASRRP